MAFCSLKRTLLPLLSLCVVVPTHAAPVSASAAPPAAQAAPMHFPKMVAYDAKDKRYYSVAYARSHAMHDKGGDPLTIIPSSTLPKEAKMSHAMHGKL